MFTNFTPTPPLSFFPILGSIQQCGELLWRERQDDSTLGVFPCVCALYQSLQGEDTSRGSIVCVFLIFFSWHADLQPFSCSSALKVLGSSCREKQGRPLAASVPQDVAQSARLNNRKGQLVLSPELQLWCLDWLFPLPPFLTLDSLTLPHHTAHFLRLFSAGIYEICSRKCAAKK